MRLMIKPDVARGRLLALLSALTALGAAMWAQAANAQAGGATIQEHSLGFCRVDGTIDSNHTGYSGAGFANADNAVGRGVDWSVSVSASGVYLLEWRFANGSSSRPGSVKVNGTPVTTLGFPSTGVWSSWTTVSTTVALRAGWNSIRLEATTGAGLANIDSLAVSGGGAAQAATCDGGFTEILIEENATGFCGVDGSVDSNHAGYTGSGFANGNAATGAGVEWKVTVPSSGNYLLEWRHANGSTANRPGSLRVNGTSIATVNFPATGAWTSWVVVSAANIALSAGESTIRLQATTSAGLSNIDSLSVTGNSPQPLECGGNASAGCGAVPALNTGRHSITVNGLHREYEVHIPGNYNANHPYRLVFDWHGRGWSARQIAQDWQEAGSLLDLSNDSAIFVAPDRYVSPTGQDDGGWPNTNGRDMDFLRALLARLNSSACIDQDRIFSVGFSFGAMMTLAVGREMGPVIRAIAPVSGAFWTPHTNRGLPMAIWISHGRQDGAVPFSNGVAARDHFVSANSCSSSTVPVSPSPCVEYQGCRAGHPVVWCAYDGGHSGPGFWETATWDFLSRF
jgi:poly(3-hydroxybutyrate) depolymerase